MKWTAVGDDGFSGRAYGYLVKYSIEPIDTIEKFRTANFATGIEPIPRVSGSTETMIIKGLTPGNSYYFAIVAYDESYNYSEISTNILVRAGGTNTITAQLVDDFEVANEINEFGGANTYTYAGTGRIWAGRVGGNPSWARGGRIGGDKIIYSNCTGGGNYAYRRYDFNGSRNLSSYKYISIWVRKDESVTNKCAFKVQLYDGSLTRARVINDYLPGGEILPYWQEAVIPLDAFDNAGSPLNRSTIQRLEFLFDNSWSNSRGTVYIDDIKFVNALPPVIYVNNHEYRYADTDVNSLNGVIRKAATGTYNFSYTNYAKHLKRSYKYYVSLAGTQYAYAFHELSSYSGNTPYRPLNILNTDKMKFWVKGSTNNQSFQVCIMQNANGSSAGYNDPYYLTGINTNWQFKEIPLDYFTAAPKDSVGIIKFLWDNKVTLSGKFIVDDLHFVNSSYDMNSPARPTNVKITNIGSGVYLNWKAPTKNGDIDGTLLQDLGGYDIYRSENSISNYVKINSSEIKTTNYIDNTALPGRTYYYIIVARDVRAPANVSIGSIPVSITVSNYSITVDDFEVNNEINEFSGANTYAYAGTGRIWAGRVSGNPGYARGGRIGGDKIIYSNCTGGGNYAYRRYDFNGGKNLSAIRYLSFWVRKERSSTNVAFKVQLNDGVNTIARVVNDYLPGGKILSYWQESVIPLDAFDGSTILNRSNIQSLEFVFDNTWNSDKGIIYIDDIKFYTKKMPAIYVNNMEYRNLDEDPNSLNGDISKAGTGPFTFQYTTNERKHGKKAYQYSVNLSSGQYAYILNGLGYPDGGSPPKPIHPLDVTGCNVIKFFVKGSAGGESFKVYIQQDAGSGAGWNESQTLTGITTSWSNRKVLLSGFTAATQTKIGYLKFVWEDGVTLNGTVYIDDIEFVNTNYDMNSPKEPTSVSYSNTGSSIVLKWIAPSNNGDIDSTPLFDLAGYDVYKSTNNNLNYFKLNSSTITATSFTDNSVNFSITNYYLIVSKDNKNNVSIPSSEISVLPGTGGVNLIINKSISNITLGPSSTNPIPGSTINYKIYYSNSGSGNASNVIIYDRIPNEVTYKSNSSSFPSGWTIEWSTNTNPDQSYNSPNYTTTHPPVNFIKWVRWKKSSVSSKESGKIFFKVIIK